MTEGNGPRLVTAAFIKKKDKYLLAFDPSLRFWRVPGGRPVWGEPVLDALKREMKEELGVEIKINKFLGFGQDLVEVKFSTKGDKAHSASRVILYFECGLVSKEIKLDPREITEIRWLTLNEIKKEKNLEPAMKDLFARGFI